MKLTVQSFFSRLIFHPMEAETKKDKSKALVASIACGIFTLGICHAVCAVKNYFKVKCANPSHELKQRFAHLTNSIFKTEEKADPVHNFFKSITPNNIDQLLNVNRDVWCKDVDKWSLGMKRDTYCDDGVVFYSCPLACGDSGWIGHQLEVENGQFKCHENGTWDTYHYFDNLDEALRYLFKGNFYQGEFFKADYYLITQADNTVIKYPNPYKI
ncbi:MAG: hypothetical protein BGO14_01510 [Chlamydiales bacterium 38-26]|nr:hypothetical protein [Chlamydiales bacterium]OJV08124.1 MAG: hypothetical protein BGO14_01510 [Chlamydiales bacterium 38-26]